MEVNLEPIKINESDCFHEAEVALGTVVPIFLKNVLKINGFDDARILASITENDYLEIEKFMSGTALQLISKEQYETFYGIFHQNPKNFQLLQGHKKVISLVSTYYKEKFQKMSSSQPICDHEKSGQTGNNEGSNFSSEPHSKRKETNAKDIASTSLSVAINLTEENAHISRTVRQWIKSKCSNEEEWNYFKEKFNQIIFQSKINGEVLCCKIKCFCTGILTILKVAKKENCAKRWVFGNIHKHLGTHLQTYLDPSSNYSKPHKLNRKVRHTNQNDLRQYFSTRPDYSQTEEVDKKINILSNEVIVPALPSEPLSQSVIVPQSVPANSGTSKWKSQKYTRQERGKRLRESQVDSQSKITDFFPIISQIDAIIKNNEDTELMATFNANTSSEKIGAGLLQKLLDMSMTNKNSGKNVFDETIKQFSLYLLYVGGRLLYETLYANLKGVLPSITCLKNFADKTSSSLEEGAFDYDGLALFLNSRRLPMVVWVSEDATRVTSKIEYEPKSNKILGFTLPLIDGFPKTDTFLPTSAKNIQKYFSESTKANYAYLIMAQPLDETAPPYCLALFGTDNKFTSNDVMLRWANIRTNLEKRGITVLGFSSDGDSRLLKSMRQNAALPSPSKCYEWDWYNAGYNKNDPNAISYIQDTVHIGTKLRTRFLKPNIVLPMGTNFASVGHLEQLIERYSKDQHFLVASDLKSEDKMNFEAAKKVCSEQVCNLLKNIPGSEATQAYLRLMRLAINSFLDPDMDIRERIFSLWYCVFYLRIWRCWISEHSSYKVATNFITQNCYTCIELNAHGLINLVKNFRDNKNLDAKMFVPSLFSSQMCERTFRTARSMTSTYSTVINNVLNDLKEVFVFPRERKKENLSISKKSDVDFAELTDETIEKIVQEAMECALNDTKKLQMKPERPKQEHLNNVSIPVLDETDNSKEKELDFDLVEVSEQTDSSLFTILPIEQTTINDEFNDPESDLYSDLTDISALGIGEEILLKTFSFPNVDFGIERGHFLKVGYSNKTAIIKKTSFIWLLDQKTSRVSTDRLRRFFATSNRKSKLKQKSAVLDEKKKVNARSSKKRNRPLSSDSSSKDENDIHYDDSTDTETFSDTNEQNLREDFLEPSTSSKTDISISKYYAVFYEESWFIGYTLKKICNKYEIKFLKKNSRNKLSFNWPKKADVDNVSPEYIFYGPINFENVDPFQLDEKEYSKIEIKYNVLKSN